MGAVRCADRGGERKGDGVLVKLPDARKIRLQAAVGREIAKRRIAAGFTMDAFAKAIEVTNSTLYKIENGECSCTVFALTLAADALDCLVDELIPILTDSEAA